MKKIININFQGRVIPIEETAFEILKEYIESLREYFSHEEGRDEIINDIESRVAELFSDRLKRITSCITDDDLNAIINNIGRPKDLEEAEGKQSATNNASASSSRTSGSGPGYQNNQQANAPRRLFRSANDKLLGGVAAGLASYFGIDPAIMRLLFVLLLFTGFGILLYIILWAAVPERLLVSNVRKRLYRNPENRMIGGVSGGIAAYLNIDPWIPRLIFVSPFVIGVIRRLFRSEWMDFDIFPSIVFNSFGGTLFISYIVLWIVLPLASSSTEKLEMRGEKVDLESIKKTVKEDLENLRGKAEKIGGEVKERAQMISSEVKQAGQSFVSESGPVIRRSGSGLIHAIGVLFKAFFLFVAGVIVFALVMGLVAILFSGVGAFPFKNFLLSGFWQNFLAWSTLILFLGIPILALLTWLIRRLMGVRSRSNNLGYSFGSLWIVGLISAILLTGSIARNFRSKTSVNEELPISQPENGKLLIKVSEGNVKYYGSDWFGFDGDLPFFSKNEDSIMLNTVQIKLIKSSDSLYHVNAVKFSNGNTPDIAERLAGKINFNALIKDSTLNLPVGFAITSNDKFRNQQVMVVVEIPVGKKVFLDRNVDTYHWFNINLNRRRGWNIHWNERWDNSFDWSTNQEYIMTSGGLEETGEFEKRKGKFKIKIDRNGEEEEGNIDQDNRKENDDDAEPQQNKGYRYQDNKKRRDTVITIHADTNRSVSISQVLNNPEIKNRHSQAALLPEAHTYLFPLSMIFE